MNRKTLSFIIGLICISLLGIIVVQFLWIRNAIHVREAQFDRSVNDALIAAVNKLETSENIYYLDKEKLGDSVRRMFHAFVRDSAILSEPKLDSLLALDEKPTPPQVICPMIPGHASQQVLYSFNYGYNLSPDQQMERMDSIIRKAEESFFSPMLSRYECFMNWNSDEIRRIDSLMILNNQDSTQVNFNYQVETDPPLPPSPPEQHRKIIKEQVIKLNKKATKVQDVIRKLTIEMEAKPRPIEERIHKPELEEILKKTFSDKDIRIPFEFAVISRGPAGPKIPVRSAGFIPEYESSKYHTTVFPNDIFEKPNTLIVHFLGKSGNILGSLSWLMIASILFTLIIVVSSGMSIFVMIRQKKVSDIKTDFINNMTHEFKTPIATISIAVDSITNPKVIDQPEVIRNYTRVIKEENNRMNTRVEQVLQMALLDSKEFRLSEDIIDMHGLLRKATDTIRLQVGSRGGELNLSCEAAHFYVRGDGAHLTNVVMSLLDNAIKYSPNRPVIAVSTINKGHDMIISIEDRGIGMNSETLHKIFDKFFRVTSGNIHNVKGFGLGLSYAKAIVMAHKGDIKVNSEPGKGSKFEIILPTSIGDV